MTTADILAIYHAHQWPILAALAIGFVVRLLKDGRLTLPPTVPSRWRPLLALGLGLASGAAEAVLGGAPWREALVGGVLSAALAALGHGVGVEGLRGGRELGQPATPKVTP